MKLRDLFKMVEINNKFNEFMSTNGYKEVQVIKVNSRGFDNEYTKAKDLIKEINEGYYGNIKDDSIELVNNNGYIEMTFEQTIPDYVNGHFEYRKNEETISLYIETKQVWG